ncbi:MAG: hypothetical protein IT204_02705 [Fimbriimonadaceae bacterium]|nr:hypothetical protein [Fimbriimonadaceae bacterium]
MRWLLLLLTVAPLSAAPADELAAPKGLRAVTATPDTQYDLRLEVTAPWPTTLLLAADGANQGYRLRAGAENLVLERLGEPAVELARCPRPSGKGPFQLLLRRRESNLQVAIDGRLQADLLDGSAAAGQVWVAAADSARVKLAEGGYQPVEDIYFTDDFMRTKEQQQLGVWQHVSGKWRFYSVLETNQKADLKLSVNPFSLGLDAEGEAPAAVITGHPFWADYVYQTSLRSRGGAWAGITFGWRSPEDHFLLRADLRELTQRPRRIELVRVKGKTETVLTGGSALLAAEQWFRLGVRLRGPRVQCLLDGDPIFDRLEPDCLGGPVGLWSRGAGSETLFDDVRVETNYTWPLDRGHDLLAGAEKQGEWRLEPSSGKIDGDPGPRRLVTSGEGGGHYVLGDPAASSYRLDATVLPRRGGRVALYFGWRDARNHLVAEWDAGSGRLGVVRVDDGKARPLGLVRDRLEPGRPHEVALDLLTAGRVQVRRDGMLRMRAAVADLPAGRCGVGASDTAAVFDDLLVRQVVPVDTEVEVDNANFSGDPFMLHWASSLADWFPKGDPQPVQVLGDLTPVGGVAPQPVYWHKGDFYRAYRITLPAKASCALLLNAAVEHWLPPADNLVTAPGVTKISTVENKVDCGDGYALHVVVGPPGRLVLLRQGVVVQEAALPEGTESLTVAHDGGVTWVQGGDDDLLVYHDPQPLTGPRVALRVAGNDVLYQVKCRREGIIDEVFERAPADWVQQGNWEITNRFSCTPTWSHMAALERKGLGALWHKAAFPGNVTIEYYAGMRMQSDYAMIYPRPGDFNTSFGCRPFSFESGISLLPGAWDADWSSVWTRYVQGGQTLLQTDRPLVPRTREDSGQRYIPVPYISAGRDVHGAWYYVKSRYLDGHLEGYFDNVKVLEGDGPAVPGDRVAIWTQDNQVVVARIRITYLDKQIPKRLVDEEAVEPESGGAPALLASAAAPALSCTFDSGTDGWQTRDKWRGVLLQQGSAGGRQYLVARNTLPGDGFEALAPLPEAGVDLSRAGLLRFDYRLPAETKINLYLKLKSGKRLVVPLTGEVANSPVVPVLARPKIVADGAWHTAVVHLGVALRQELAGGDWPALLVTAAPAPAEKRPLLTELAFGNQHEGYLLAGFGGNPRGAWYAIDNLTLASEVVPGTPVAATFTAPPKAGAPSLKAVRMAFDRSGEAAPTTVLPDAEVKAPSTPGLWFLTAQGEWADGSRTPLTRLPLLVLAAAPQLTPVDVDRPWDGGRLRVALGEGTPGEWAVTVADKVIPADQVSWDAAARELLVDARVPGLSYTDGQAVPVKVTVKQAGGAAGEASFQRTFKLAADTTPPLPPSISGPGVLASSASGKAPFTAANPAATAVVLDPADGPEPGAGSVRIVNLVPSGSYDTYLLQGDYDAGRAPLLLFDYKTHAPLRTDFAVYTPGEYHSILFTDQAAAYPTLGAVPEATRDGQWHRGQFKLQEGLLGASPFAPNLYSLRYLVAADYGYSGGAPGASYQIDNVRLVGVGNGQTGVTLRWAANDPAGIAGWRWGFGQDETAAPTTEVAAEVTSQLLTAPAEGLYWFSVQARDGAGNWSRVARWPLLLDNAPLSFGTAVPAPGGLGTWDITVPLANVGPAGLDPAALRLTAGGKAVAAVEGDVYYNQANHTLNWIWAWATKQFGGPVADGTPIQLAVAGKDLAGETVKPATYAYTVSYAADKQPPLSPDVTVAGQTAQRVSTCTQGLGQFGNISAGYRSPRQRMLDDLRNDYVCEVTSAGSGLPLAYGGYDLKANPYFSVDYRLSGSLGLHLMAYINGAYYSIALTQKSPSYKQIGSAPVVADNKWHTLFIDLLSLYEQGVGKAEKITCTYIFLNEYGSAGGVKYSLDNAACYGPVPLGEVAANWVCYDATGIQGAAVSLTPGLDAAEPPTLTPQASSAKLPAAQAGIYLLQVRARDGAGNWGGTARRVVVAR